MKRKYIILVLMTFLFIIFSDKVYARENCLVSTYPSCCVYDSQSGFGGAVFRIDFSDEKPVIYSAWVFKIGNVTPTLVWDNDVKEYVKSLTKCPPKIKYDKKTKKIYIKDIIEGPISNDEYTIIDVDEPSTEDENKKYDDELQKMADQINEAIQERIDMGCENPNIYNPNSDEYNITLASKCAQKNTYFTVANYSDQFKEAEKRGMTRENYPGLDNLYKSIERRNQFSAEQDEREEALTQYVPVNPDLPSGDPMTCESLRDTDTYKIVKEIFKWVQIIAPIMLIIFGIMDFVKPVISSDNDAIKKAQSAFVKRLIVVAAIILLPFILDFFLSLLDGAMGNNIGSCEIGK